VSLDELLLDGGKGTVATADFAATVPLGEEPGAIDARGTADLALHRLVDLLAIEQSGKQTLPEKMSLDFHAATRCHSATT
jgi:hypothetical protein